MQFVDEMCAKRLRRLSSLSLPGSRRMQPATISWQQVDAGRTFVGQHCNFWQSWQRSHAITAVGSSWFIHIDMFDVRSYKSVNVLLQKRYVLMIHIIHRLARRSSLQNSSGFRATLETIWIRVRDFDCMFGWIDDVCASHASAPKQDAYAMSQSPVRRNGSPVCRGRNEQTSEQTNQIEQVEQAWTSMNKHEQAWTSRIKNLWLSELWR